MTDVIQYKVKMQNFEGPLDLLYHLVEKNKMNIFDIKINDITDQYLDYLQEMQDMNLEVTSEFIVMAARLIYLKSKTLLPTVEENPEYEVDIVQMLLEYKKYKENSEILKDRLEEYGRKFYKTQDKIELPKGKPEKIFSPSFIPEAYSEFIKKQIEKKNIYANNLNRLAVSEKVTIKSKIKEILKQLWTKPSFIFNKIFNVNQKSRTEIVTAFLSLLELSRMRRITVTQDRLFGDINVKKTKREKTN